MTQSNDWNLLLSLLKKLNEQQIAYHVDGRTIFFVHGEEVPLDKICLTFFWGDEERIKQFFDTKEPVKINAAGNFKYFDTFFQGKLIRCMFYQNESGTAAREDLHDNAELLEKDGVSFMAQTVKFYYEHKEKA